MEEERVRVEGRKDKGKMRERERNEETVETKGGG